MVTEKMRTRRQKGLARRAHRGRSDLYRQVRESYPDLIEQKVGTRQGPAWDDVAAQLASEGARDRSGKPPSGDTIRKMFGRIRRDLAAEAAHHATGVRPVTLGRSRAAPDWKPTPATASFAEPSEPRMTSAETSAQRPGLLSRIGRSLVDRPARLVEKPAEAAPPADPDPLDLPSEGGPLTPEQVRAMMADLRRTLNERSGR